MLLWLHSILADSPQNICAPLEFAEQVGGKDLSLMPDDRGACLLSSWRTNALFSSGTVRLVTLVLLRLRLLCSCMLSLLQEFLILIILVKITLTRGQKEEEKKREKKRKMTKKPVNSLSLQAKLQLSFF